jgi:hypothetical protein
VRRLLVALLTLPTLAAPPQPPPIKQEAIAAHIRFLADDLLEGRETGSRGFEIAARYVAAQFSAMGLQPGGDGGTYFQHIPFRSAKTVPARCEIIVRDGRREVVLESKKDFLLRANFLSESSDVTAPVVFAGYGIVAPELKHDDYAGLDAKGKIVIVLTSAPAAFPSDQRAYYSSGLVKEQAAAAHGAVGFISLRSITDERRYSFEKSVNQSGIASMRYLDCVGQAILPVVKPATDRQDCLSYTPADALPQIKAAGLISRSGATAFFARAPMPLDRVLADAEEGTAHSFALEVSATIRTVSQWSEAKSENVVATLPGSDPALRDEYVVVSAHLDHLGNHGTGDDAVYNGAYDNGSGIAAMLEIARAFASLEQAPQRSLLFVALTGEEKGEQGSEYFAAHPPIAKGSLVADVNMDMFLMLFPTADLVALGGEHTSLGRLAADASAIVGMPISPDPIPEEVRFIRSDQYSFVKEGIPAIHLKTGSKSLDPAIDGDKLTKEWLRNIYHSPKDDLSQPFDFATGVRYAQTNFLIALGAATGGRPSWNKGDFFGEKFGRK